MLQRYAHPALAPQIAALESYSAIESGHKTATASGPTPVGQATDTAQPTGNVNDIGGRQEARTPDLRVANAALSQLS
jgi:hypothetical protein